MKRTIACTLAAMTLLLSGCATTISSNVVSYSQWPAEMADKTFVFTMPRSDTVEYRAAENLVREQLRRHGMRDAAAPGAKLNVAVDLMTGARDVRTIAPVMIDPFWPGYGWYGPRRWHRGWYGHGLYSPFWTGPYMGYQETVSTHFHRQLRVTVTEAGSGRKVYETMAENHSRQADPMRVLPAMVTAAFEGFPGGTGTVRRVEVKTEN